METDLFHNPERFADMETWRDGVAALHANGPVHRVEADGFRPFWAVIGHPEVMEVERQGELFHTEPEAVLISDEMRAAQAAQGLDIRTIVHMDEPDHGKYRRLTADWFKPSSLGRLEDRLAELSREALAAMRAAGGEIDFATEVAVRYPLQVILAILGLPQDDYERMLTLTQELFGGTDPDLQREAQTPEEAMQVLVDFFDYFNRLTHERRATPTEDLASQIANGIIDGEPLPDLETMSYYVIVATAGHDTTSATMAEGICRLAQNPEQREALKSDPSLIKNAVEEMIRLSSPVKHFMREAAEDTILGGRQIAKGDWLLLSYAAANLDPRVFDDPLRFDITRENADKQIAFGFGMHFCLGAQLARMEIRSLFEALIPELESLELAGPPATSEAVFVSGHKRLPIRYTLATSG